MSRDENHERVLFDRYHFIALWAASKYSSRSLAAEWDDVHADAWIGVLDAVRRFDPNRGSTQKAYAFRRARGEAIDGIRRRRYTGRGARDTRQPLSLDGLREAIDDGELDLGDVERGYGEVDAAETIPLLLVALSRRRRFVIEARYLAGRSLADIGRELGVTESMASRIHTQALRQMRGMLGE